QDKEVVVVCANGRQSTTAQLQMKKEGFTASRLNGGLIEWSVANLPPIKEQKGKRETSQELSQS
ncbi:MAG: rhodanese-like domain-containing protein, partial [Candidatus Portiera sp.]|nr:rhodanese-like domain-containing protein [Portiera sp.]